MIFHLLIVDDEATMRKGLSSFINWESMDCVVTDTACDGIDAIDKILHNPIDIVISDIKMPEMDGLGLAKYIHEKHPNIIVILLTGYGEFEYARTAIRYNVSQFLVKPTSKEEIISAVKEAQQKIIITKKHNSIAKNEFAFLKDQFLQELTDGIISSDVTKRLDSYGIFLNNYFVVAFQLPNSISDVKQLKELIINLKKDSYCFRYNNLVLSIYYQTDIIPVIENANEIANVLQNLYSQKASIGISQQHHGVLEFQTATSEAIHSLSLNFYSTSCIAIFDKQNVESEYVLSVDITLSLYELENSILNRDFITSNSIINSLFINLKRNFANANDVKNICFQIYYLAFRVFAKHQLFLPTEDILARIQQSTDIFQLEFIIEELLASVQKELSNTTKKYSEHIQNTIKYIQSNLACNISLDQISRYVHVSESYLSRTFKKECGYSITEYITTLRIEKSKDLLANSDLLTYEVSELVGIHDPSYFSLLFKKYTGLSPKEYRNQFISIK